MYSKPIPGFFLAILVISCIQSEDTARSGIPQPVETIDLGALVTEELPQRVWGKAVFAEQGWTGLNSFDAMEWEQDLPGGTISGSNSYYTFFNHGGPHVDAPNHVGIRGGLDSYPVEVFSGPVKAFDVSHLAPGRTIDIDFFKAKVIDPHDIVLIHTGYQPPQNDTSYPRNITMTRDAAEYLAKLPIRAIGTDAHSLYTYDDDRPIEADSVLGRAAPVHESFLSRDIPIYEQLFNVDRLLGKQNMFFTGVPLNIENGDGMIVRPVVFVY